MVRFKFRSIDEYVSIFEEVLTHHCKYENWPETKLLLKSDFIYKELQSLDQKVEMFVLQTISLGENLISYLQASLGVLTSFKTEIKKAFKMLKQEENVMYWK